MPVESAAGHERASLYRISRITMEITTSLGSHTDSSRSFLRWPFRFLSHLQCEHHNDEVSVPLSSILLLTSPFVFVYTYEVRGANAFTWESTHETILRFRFIALLLWPLRSNRSFPLPTFLAVKLSLPRLRFVRVNIVCKHARSQFQVPASSSKDIDDREPMQARRSLQTRFISL